MRAHEGGAGDTRLACVRCVGEVVVVAVVCGGDVVAVVVVGGGVEQRT